MALNKQGKALIIGINNYDNPKAKLRSCENDATRMHELLTKHENGDSNFDAHLKLNITCEQLRTQIEKLLFPQRAAHHALIYFSGHGYVNTNGGYLVGRDYTKEDLGVSMEWLIDQLKASSIPHITLIFDCCYAAAFAQQESEGRLLASLPENVTLLAATRNDDVAQEGPQHGQFTKVLIQGLEGAAADALGRVTSASLYNIADTVLSSWQQRPVFKSYVTEMPVLRNCEPQVTKELLTSLISRAFFKDRKSLQLKPKDLQVNPSKERSVNRFAQLNAFQQAGLIRCTNNHTVYEAAILSEACEITPMGHFFLELFQKNRLPS